MAGELYKPRYGTEYICINCNTSYVPENRDDFFGVARCNKHSIDLCPWCRIDSTPWKYGRGI